MANSTDVAFNLHPRQSEAFLSQATEILYGGAAGGGKALAVDTPVPTPDGWTTMGELSVGDAVFDNQGKPTKVVAISDVRHDRPCYRLTFDDGASLVADGDHRWLTMTNAEREQASKRTPEYRSARRERRKKTGQANDQTLPNSTPYASALFCLLLRGRFEQLNIFLKLSKSVDGPIIALKLPIRWICLNLICRLILTSSVAG